MNEEDLEWLVKQLHSAQMQCRQCDLVRTLLVNTGLLDGLTDGAPVA